MLVVEVEVEDWPSTSQLIHILIWTDLFLQLED